MTLTRASTNSLLRSRPQSKPRRVDSTDSTHLQSNPIALQSQLQTDGYLLLRNALDRDEVQAARKEVTNRLAAAGYLEPATDPMEAIAASTYKDKFLPDAAKEDAPLLKLLYAGRMMEVFRALFAGDVLHFDYTWFRAISPGHGTPPHCDSVYMNRGSQKLLTAWTPIGDCTFEMGGLLILEGSAHNQRLRETYCKTDVDAFCKNKTGPASKDAWEKKRGGVLSRDPAQLQKSLGGRWLTEEFRAGDLLIFDIFTVHASADNHSNRVRLSSDTRYQPANDPADERWIGAAPPAHGPEAQKNLLNFPEISSLENRMQRQKQSGCREIKIGFSCLSPRLCFSALRINSDERPMRTSNARQF